MAWGGGSFLTHNKVLSGAYLNFISRLRASIALSDRGILAAPLFLNWGKEDDVFDVSPDELQTSSLKLFGYSYDAPEMLPLREIFSTGVRLLKVFRLKGESVQAKCAPGGTAIATARYGGTRGNDLRLTIAANVDDDALWDVKTYLGNELLEVQTGVTDAAALVDNDFVVFNKAATLAAAVAAPFTGGSNGTVGGMAFQNALDAFEGHGFHVLLCPVADQITVRLFVNYTKRMRDEVGAKFVLAAYHAVDEATGYTADYEGVVSVNNDVTGFPAGIDGLGAHALVYWVAGALASCAVNVSLLNRRYNGELAIKVPVAHQDLEAAIKAGKFIFHRAGDAMRVLADINTLVTLTQDKGYVFQSNQVIRVCDQIANDIAAYFNDRYLGLVQNDQDGRNDFKGGVCLLITKLEALRAVQNFDPDTVDVLEGEKKDEVIANLNELDIVGVMGKLYMTVVLV